MGWRGWAGFGTGSLGSVVNGLGQLLGQAARGSSSWSLQRVEGGIGVCRKMRWHGG